MNKITVPALAFLVGVAVARRRKRAAHLDVIRVIHANLRDDLGDTSPPVVVRSAEEVRRLTESGGAPPNGILYIPLDFGA